MTTDSMAQMDRKLCTLNRSPSGEVDSKTTLSILLSAKDSKLTVS